MLSIYPNSKNARSNTYLRTRHNKERSISLCAMYFDDLHLNKDKLGIQVDFLESSWFWTHSDFLNSFQRM